MISKNEFLFFGVLFCFVLFLKIEDVCVFMLMEMIRRERQFHDVGDRGDNWKSNVFEKARKCGLQEIDTV